MWGYIGQFIFGFLQYYRFYEVALSKLSGSFNVFFNEGVQGKIAGKDCWERLLGNIYLFLTPSRTDGVLSQQGALITCNLTYWEVSQQM